MNKVRDFVVYHVREALIGALAEVDGNKSLCRYLRARSRLRLITMTEEELWGLSEMVAYSPERSTEEVYQGLKRNIEEYKQTLKEWIKDLQQNTFTSPAEKMPYRVLIVENELSLRQDLFSAFQRAKFEVAGTTDYSEAIQVLYESKVDLVIMESRLSDNDGFEACRNFRTIFNIPVILMGKDYSDEVWDRVSMANADFYEVKPCNFAALVARAKAILRRYELIPMIHKKSPNTDDNQEQNIKQ